MSNEIQVIAYYEKMNLAEMPISYINPKVIYDHPKQVEIMGPSVKDDELWASVEKHGVRYPLYVRKPDEDGKFRAIAGHQRRDAAIDAGFELVPAYVIEFEYEWQEDVVFVETNYGRQKTSAQVNRMVLLAASAAKEQAQLRQRKGLKRGAVSDDSPLPPVGDNGSSGGSGEIAPPSSPVGDNGESGRTAEVVARQVGRSTKEVERRMWVCDPEYADKFFAKMRGGGASDEVVNECRSKWIDVRRRLDQDEVSVSAAAAEVKELQGEYLARCPKAKVTKGKGGKGKGAKPKPGKGKAQRGRKAAADGVPIPPFPDGAALVEGAETFTVLANSGVSGVEYGMRETADDRTPAIRVDGVVYVLPFSTLYSEFVRPRVAQSRVPV